MKYGKKLIGNDHEILMVISNSKMLQLQLIMCSNGDMCVTVFDGRVHHI